MSSRVKTAYHPQRTEASRVGVHSLQYHWPVQSNQSPSDPHHADNPVLAPLLPLGVVLAVVMVATVQSVAGDCAGSLQVHPNIAFVELWLDCQAYHCQIELYNIALSRSHNFVQVFDMLE